MLSDASTSVIIFVIENLILIRTKFVCGQRVVPCATLDGCLHGQTGPVLDARQCRCLVVLHDGGDVSDWRSLADVFKVYRP